MSICERDLCHGVQDFTLEVDDALEGDFRLEIMEENEYYIYTFPLTAQLSKPDEQKDLWTMRVDNAENETYPEEWVCWGQGDASPIVRLVRIHIRLRGDKSRNCRCILRLSSSRFHSCTRSTRRSIGLWISFESNRHFLLDKIGFCSRF